MMSNPLYIALKKAVDDLGMDILNSPMLVNVLTDYHAFDVHDPNLQKRKKLISEFVEKGFTNKLLRWRNNRSTCINKSVEWIKVYFANELLNKQTATLVKEIAEAFLYSCGVDSVLVIDDYNNTFNSSARKSTSNLTKIVSPIIVEKTVVSTTNNSRRFLHNKLTEELKKYNELLHSFLIVETDENGFKHASIKVTDSKELLICQNNIIRLENQLGLPSTNFYQIRADLTTKYSSNTSSKDRDDVEQYHRLFATFISTCDSIKKDGSTSDKLQVLDDCEKALRKLDKSGRVVLRLYKLKKEAIPDTQSKHKNNSGGEDDNKLMGQTRITTISNNFTTTSATPSALGPEERLSKELSAKKEYTHFLEEKVDFLLIDGVSKYYLPGTYKKQEKVLRNEIVLLDSQGIGADWCDKEMQRIIQKKQKKDSIVNIGCISSIVALIVVPSIIGLIIDPDEVLEFFGGLLGLIILGFVLYVYGEVFGDGGSNNRRKRYR